MTGKTHRAGGMLCSIVGFAILREKGLLLPDVNEGVQWLIMYPFCMWGSVASDLDHHWESCPSKDYPSWLVHKALHITAPVKNFLDNSSGKSNKSSIIYKIADFFNSSHRSWQTHSDLTLFLMIWLLQMILEGAIGGLSAVDSTILSLVITGVCLGILAHFVLDIITPDGIWLFGIMLINKIFKLKIPDKLHLVPRSKYFATGGAWEELINKLLRIATWISLVWLLLTIFYPNWTNLFPYTIEFD